MNIHEFHLFLSCFTRILTEPVNKDPGSRRRGRRPRSEMPKPLLSVSDSSPSALGPPLFMNGGLIGSMDTMVAMQNLRGAIPGLPISGIMAAGFPHGFPAAVTTTGAAATAEDAKNGLSMLPMMLHGIPHPHGAAISHPSSTTPAERENATASPSGGEKEKKDEKGGEGNKRAVVAESAAIITSTSRAHLGAAHLGAGTGSHLTFNPFLIPGMSHGLLYPHMFLPHGGIMALPAMPSGATDSSPGSPKRRRKKGEKEEEKEREEEEKESTVKVGVASSSSPSVPSTSVPDPAEEPQTAVGENGPSESQEPDSHNQPEGAATEEGGGEAMEEDEEEQRQAEGEEG
uniref:Chromodomain helicase DNA binding protein 7 n=1 Tax=Sphaeramia orbicularis TaxID=375764 RepID=A0A672ZAX5_9TELE